MVAAGNDFIHHSHLHREMGAFPYIENCFAIGTASL